MHGPADIGVPVLHVWDSTMSEPEFLNAFRSVTASGLYSSACTPQSFVDSRSLSPPAQHDLAPILTDFQLDEAKV